MRTRTMLVALLIGCILAIWPAQGRISVAHLGKTVRQQRANPLAQRLTDAASRELYEEEEQVRRHENSEPLGDRETNITRARQGVTGHNVNVVLATSLALALFAGVGLFVFVWVIRG